MESINSSKRYVKINLPGGIVSTGDFSQLLESLDKSGITEVRFGTRQQLLFAADADQIEDLEHDFLISTIDFEIDADQYPNIVSSYVTEDLFNNPNWLREGLYKDILETFDYSPRLKINLVDSSQNLIPFSTGNLNFCSSDISNYWHLYIRFPKTNTLYTWSSLIYSEDIAAISLKIESLILANPDLFFDQVSCQGELLEAKVTKEASFPSQEITSPLKLPEFELPYYEGFSKYNDRFWLGIYRRQECFPIPFLRELCDICNRSRIGQLYTTPWKSLIIKGITADDKRTWSALLDKYRINTHHAANELNWITEDLCEEGLQLKLDLIRQLNEIDLRSFRLCFAIKTNPKTGLFGSVIIKKTNDDQYDLLHTTDFNPHTKIFKYFQQNLSRAAIIHGLKELCSIYYIERTENELKPQAAEIPKPTERIKPKLYQCSHCLSLYDPRFGDEQQEIPRDTPFAELPDEYRCFVCDASKLEFKSIILEDQTA